MEFDGKDVDIDPGGAFYSTDFSFDGLAIMADTVDFPEKAKEVLVPDSAGFPESFDEAYSGAGKTHLCQQVENQKEYAI